MNAVVMILRLVLGETFAALTKWLLPDWAFTLIGSTNG